MIKPKILPIAVAILACIRVAQADHPGGELQLTASGRWQTFDLRMSPQDYHAVSHRNLQLFRKAARGYFEDAMNAAGIPEQAMTLIAPTVGLLARGARLHLDQDKTFALELDDLVNSDRSVRLQMKLNW